MKETALKQDSEDTGSRFLQHCRSNLTVSYAILTLLVRHPEAYTLLRQRFVVVATVSQCS